MADDCVLCVRLAQVQARNTNNARSVATAVQTRRPRAGIVESPSQNDSRPESGLCLDRKLRPDQITKRVGYVRALRVALVRAGTCARIPRPANFRGLIAAPLKQVLPATTPQFRHWTRRMRKTMKPQRGMNSKHRWEDDRNPAPACGSSSTVPPSPPGVGQISRTS
jgi:hypothetical protein